MSVSSEPVPFVTVDAAAMWAVLSIVPPGEFVEHAVEFGLPRPLLHDGVQVRMEQLVVFKSGLTAAGSPLVQIVERLSEVIVQQLLQVKFAGFCDGDICLADKCRKVHCQVFHLVDSLKDLVDGRLATLLVRQHVICHQNPLQ